MATFTRKHYKELATVLHETLAEYEDYVGRAVVEAVVDRLAELFEEDNPSFDSDKFRERVGL